MERLIEIVMDNIVWLVIAAGALFSFLKKAAGGETGRRPERGGPAAPQRPRTVTTGVPSGGRPVAPPYGREMPRQAAPPYGEPTTGPTGLPERPREMEHAGRQLAEQELTARPLAADWRPSEEQLAADGLAEKQLADEEARMLGLPPGNNPADTKQQPLQGVSGADARDLMAGIVWSEVLGPPRAKRPLATRRRG